MPLDLTCEDFGLSQEEMLNRLLNKMADKLLDAPSKEHDPEDDEYAYATKNNVEDKIIAIMHQRVDDQVKKIAEAHVIPKIDDLIENLVFQETNAWGEAKKPPQTIREWLESQSMGWLNEKVDYNGKTKNEESYNWREHSTRLVYIIEKHVALHLDAGIQKATENIHATFAGHVSDLVNQMIASMKVTTNVNVKVPR